LRPPRHREAVLLGFGIGESLADLTYGDGHDGSPRYSEEEARLIGAEVRRLIDEARERARRVLRESRTVLGETAAALLDRETLSAEEFELIARRPAVPAT